MNDVAKQFVDLKPRLSSSGSCVVVLNSSPSSNVRETSGRLNPTGVYGAILTSSTCTKPFPAMNRKGLTLTVPAGTVNVSVYDCQVVAAFVPGNGWGIPKYDSLPFASRNMATA